MTAVLLHSTETKVLRIHISKLTIPFEMIFSNEGETKIFWVGKRGIILLKLLTLQIVHYYWRHLLNMCVRVRVCTCARSKLITISPYCNSNIRLVILSEKAWLVISLVVSFRFSRHLFSVINFLHFFSICKCRIWQNKYCIVLHESPQILQGNFGEITCFTMIA